MTFLEKLSRAQQKNRSYLCIGLDIVVSNTPLPLQYHDEPMLPFARAIIEATQDLVCAYKPNLGFYLAEGAAGMVALERIVRAIPPDIPIILDGKFGDIGNTAQAYARGAFEQFHADAVTLSPYMGSDSVKPFLADKEKGVFVTARTSNPNAGEFQALSVIHESSRMGASSSAREGSSQFVDQTLYEQVALAANRWHVEGPGACGLVVGATAPAELERIRAISPRAAFPDPRRGGARGRPGICDQIRRNANRHRPGDQCVSRGALCFEGREFRRRGAQGCAEDGGRDAQTIEVSYEYN